ncbi:hypothetical protein BOX15_Mlig007696g2 [Macrostomum lignano]|uniref:Prefoldin subunit 1 n=2 Tax=Macrostomum lignano TaxID=282301 RepID=A0A267GK96_9PLAT|nr:hypothetical protein BOX15_Mlig007696g2 [Macrostomum lignano]
MASSGVDMELKEAITQLQQKKLQTNQQLMFQSRQMDQLQKDVRHRQLVLEELASINPEGRVYSSVGRMFMLQPVDEIRAEIRTKISASEEKAKTLEANKTYLEQSLKEAENNLREMIQAKHGK